MTGVVRSHPAFAVNAVIDCSGFRRWLLKED
jgi:hypothetical protein